MRFMYKRNCTNYIFSVAFLSFLVTLYILGLRQSRQLSTGFNLRPLKVKREIRRTFTQTERLRHERKDGVEGVRQYQLAGRIPTSQSPKGHHDVLIHDQRHGHEAKLQTRPVDQRNESNGPLEIYVVEEHHEVIPRWFAAARRGLIPKSGNTLIHIDGHADLAPLYYLTGYPFFKWPSEKQLKYLMQTNDGFIQGASIAGLVNRVIWVWPDWDSNNHEAQYVMSTLNLGWVAIKSTDKRRQKEKAFCFCMKNETSIDCRSMLDLNGDYNVNKTDGFVIPRHRCNIMRTIIVEEIHENKAISFLSRSDWIAPSESLMIDIDEDYYGCSYAIEPLLSANLSFHRVKHLDKVIISHLCPISTEHERTSDLFLMELISLIRIQRACQLDKALTNSTKCRIASKINTIKHFQSQLSSLESNGTIRLCPGSHALSIVKSLMQAFSRLRITQLKALQSVGFCSSTSPKTFDLYGGRKFGLCYGINTPHATAMSVHVPSSSEIVARTIILKGLLRKLKRYSPSLVTIARSVRDGYTPRQFFEKIEESILTAIQNSIGPVNQAHYDRDLLGGKPGWPARHKA